MVNAKLGQTPRPFGLDDEVCGRHKLAIRRASAFSAEVKAEPSLAAVVPPVRHTAECGGGRMSKRQSGRALGGDAHHVGTHLDKQLGREPPRIVGQVDNAQSRQCSLSRRRVPTLMRGGLVHDGPKLASGGGHEISVELLGVVGEAVHVPVGVGSEGVEGARAEG